MVHVGVTETAFSMLCRFAGNDLTQLENLSKTASYKRKQVSDGEARKLTGESTSLFGDI